MDNKKFCEPMHATRIKEIQLDHDFKVVPESIFKALSHWYSCNFTIKRSVISYKAKKEFGKSLALTNQASSNVGAKPDGIGEGLHRSGSFAGNTPG